MGLRTYLPTLLAIGRLMCDYIRRHEAKIKANVGAENEGLVDAVLTACEALEVVLETLVPHGT